MYLEWFSLTNYHGSTTGGVIIINRGKVLSNSFSYSPPLMEAPTPGGVGAFSMLFTLFHFINVQKNVQIMHLPPAGG